MENKIESIAKLESEVTSLSEEGVEFFSSFFEKQIDNSDSYSNEEKEKVKRQHTPENILKKYREGNYLYMLAMVSNQVVGVLEAKIVGVTEKNKILSEIFAKLSKKGFQSFGYMAWILVDSSNPNIARTGVGSKLYLHAQKDFLMKGVDILVACVKTDNSSSIEFHKKNGYTIDDALDDSSEYVWFTKKI